MSATLAFFLGMIAGAVLLVVGVGIYVVVKYHDA
jgi:heme/copper-type cytochrome/quinol oxidase subunit 2